MYIMAINKNYGNNMNIQAGNNSEERPSLSEIE